MISADEIEARVGELGAAISDEYRDNLPMLVTVLRGAWMFAADLSRRLSIEHTVDFLSVSSYAGGESTGLVRVAKDVDDEINDRHVLLVEDIVDTGRTLTTILELLLARRPASLRVVTLLDKSDRRVAPVTVDFVGFEIPNVFVVGYGLDLDGHYRGLQHIAAIDGLE